MNGFPQEEVISIQGTCVASSCAEAGQVAATADAVLDCAASVLKHLLTNSALQDLGLALKAELEAAPGYSYYRDLLIGHKQWLVSPAFGVHSLPEDYYSGPSDGAQHRPLWFQVVVDCRHLEGGFYSKPTFILFRPIRAFLQPLPDTPPSAWQDILACCDLYEELTSLAPNMRWEAGDYVQWFSQSSLASGGDNALPADSFQPFAGECSPGLFDCCSNEACPSDAVCNQYGFCECAPGVECGETCGPCGCGETCDNGECVFHNCDGKECGDDGCEGTCGECAPGLFCGAGKCYPHICFPKCIFEGKECGDDGCGGSCGECEWPNSCDDAGQCVPDESLACQGLQCGESAGFDCGECECGFNCEDGQCVGGPCDGKECGDDGCGGTCGECTDEDACIDGQCICPPDCANKECGDDGCGGSCGDCNECGEGCINGDCIFVACSGKECGPDGCGGTCGTCDPPLECQDGGQCLWFSSDGLVTCGQEFGYYDPNCALSLLEDIITNYGTNIAELLVGPSGLGALPGDDVAVSLWIAPVPSSSQIKDACGGLWDCPWEALGIRLGHPVPADDEFSIGWVNKTYVLLLYDSAADPLRGAIIEIQDQIKTGKLAAPSYWPFDKVDTLQEWVAGVEGADEYKPPHYFVVKA